MPDAFPNRRRKSVFCGAPVYFHLFGPAHLAILSGVVLLGAMLAAIQRRLPPGFRGLRIGFGVVLLSNAMVWYGYLALHGQLIFPDQLPLELCDVTLILTVIALFTLNRAIFDLAYYGALAGTSMALLTPDLWEAFPSFGTVEFFVAHGLVVSAVLYLVGSRRARPRPGSVARAMLALNVYAALVGVFDWRFKTDYMYLRSKPENVSLFNVLGQWPWYIAASEGVALVLFLLLYLPFRNSRSYAQQ